MKERVIVEEMVYEKGKRVFAEGENSIQWIPSPERESAISAAIESSGARIVVLGVTRYENSIYRALAGNAGDAPALIARFGVGFDNINAEICRHCHIVVTNTPGMLDQSVAEHAVAMLLALARNIPLLDARMRSGSCVPLTGFELFHQSLGIAGFGRIGKKLAEIASRGFGMRIHVFDAMSLDKQAAKENISSQEFLRQYSIEGYHTDFQDLAREVRILSIHMPVTDMTRGFFSRQRLALLGDGTVLINTSRGALIDECALYEALDSDQIASAALDVFCEEPYKPVSPTCDLRKLPNVVLTPHVASNTIEANIRMAQAVLENVQHFLSNAYELLNRVI